MKKLVGLLFLMLFVSRADSQILISLLLGDKLNSESIEFGLEGGLNFSTLSGMETNASRPALNLGFYFDIQMKEQFWLHTGFLAVSTFGAAKLTTNDLMFLDATQYEIDGDYNQAIHYFLLPALAKYKFKNHFYIEAGPQFGLAYKSWVEFVEVNDDLDARLREFNFDQIKRFDIGLRGGIGYKLMQGQGMNIGISYYYGFSEIYKHGNGIDNRSLFLIANIPIGRAKKVTE